MTIGKTIILLRHAKSSWKHPGLDDHDRPLNKRGRAAAPVIGRWLLDHGYVPKIILCSTSTRTRETVERLGLPTSESVAYQPDLYHASTGDLLESLRSCSDHFASVMIVGHQPGLSAFAEMLSGQVPPHCAEAFEHFPTAAAAVFKSSATSWKHLRSGQAEFIDFAKPRDLVRE